MAGGSSGEAGASATGTRPAFAEAAALEVSVIVPVLDEEDGVAACHDAVVAALEGAGRSFEIVFVDDGSTDGTIEIIRGLAGRDRRVGFVRLWRNFGQQYAMYTALPHCRGECIITYDADLQFDPAVLPRLADKVAEGFDVVGGYRVGRRDSLVLNRLPSRIGQFLINRALDVRQRDFGGVKAYRRALIGRLLRLPPRHVVIPAMAYSLTRNYAEIPVDYHARRHGRSKWSLLARVGVFLDIYTLYARRPFQWMLVVGAASVGLGVVLGVGIVAYKFFVSPKFSGLIIFFDVFLLLVGIVLAALSLLGEFVVRAYRGTFMPELAVAEEHTGASREN